MLIVDQEQMGAGVGPTSTLTVFQSPEKTKTTATKAAHPKKKTKRHVKQSMFLNSSIHSGSARL